MNQAEKEAERIIEMFGSKAILHVEGIIETLTWVHDGVLCKEFESQPSIGVVYRKYLFWQQVKQAIEKA